LYVDAAWKTRPNQNIAKAGLGVYFVFQDQGYTSDVLITASSPALSAPIQAEAQALLLAGNIIASSLNLRVSVLFTDCSNLAKAVAAPGASDQAMLWEIRRQTIEFQNTTATSALKVFYISREIDGIAHQCTHQANLLTRARPIRFCGNSAHRNLTCPVLVAINRLHLLDTVITYVRCL
jgi:hypothetical protein